MPAQRNPRLARVFGIDVEFHWTWLIILYVFAYFLADSFHSTYRNWGETAVWGVAIITTLLFFASVVLHELAHSLTARAYGLPVHTITLFIFGGVSELTREPDKAGEEFVIAIAGPLTSLVIGGICLGLAAWSGRQSPVGVALWWLGAINVVLAAFNLIPGFPLDGGRVLRAILWSSSRNFVSATRWATRVGKAVALLFILWGVVRFLQGAGFGALWIAFIGWFLLMAAEQSWRQIQAKEALASFTVRDLANPFFTAVPPQATVESYVQQLAESRARRPSLVMDDDDHLLGVISPENLRETPRARWPELRVRDLMVPRERVATAALDEGLMDALQKMAVGNLSQLPVLEEDHVRGVIRRERILDLLQGRAAAG